MEEDSTFEISDFKLLDIPWHSKFPRLYTANGAVPQFSKVFRSLEYSVKGNLKLL